MDEVSSSALRPAAGGPLSGDAGHVGARGAAVGRNGDMRRHPPGREADRRVGDRGRSEPARMQAAVPRMVGERRPVGFG